MKDNSYFKMLVGKNNGNPETLHEQDFKGAIVEIDTSILFEKWETDIKNWQSKAECSAGPEKYAALGIVSAIKDCETDLENLAKAKSNPENKKH